MIAQPDRAQVAQVLRKAAELLDARRAGMCLHAVHKTRATRIAHEMAFDVFDSVFLGPGEVFPDPPGTPRGIEHRVLLFLFVAEACERGDL